MKIDTSAFNQISADLRAAGTKALPLVAVATEKAIREIETDAKRFAPVDTGNLRSSIGSQTTVSSTSVSAEAYATADYAEYVERGTARMAPHAYMGPAFDRHAGEWTDAVTQAAEKAIGGALG